MIQILIRNCHVILYMFLFIYRTRLDICHKCMTVADIATSSYRYCNKHAPSDLDNSFKLSYPIK